MYKPLIVFSIALIALKCDGKKEFNAQLKINASAKKPTQKDSLLFQLKIPQNTNLDSIRYQIGEKIVKAPLPLTQFPLGKHQLKATVYTDTGPFTFSKDFWIYASEKPKLLRYRIINQFPHDANAYTQGLEFDGDILYESTGLKGRSSIRKIAYQSGDLIKEQKLDQVYFGEGLTLVNDHVIQLTWKANMGFVYDKETLQMENTFAYQKSKEGWGLCHDSSNLYKSDGTHQIWLLNPETFEEKGKIQVMTPSNPVNKINELEWAEGLIYANTYQFQKDVAVVIQPKTGAVEGVVDFTGLREKLRNNPKAEVLNGIAYHPQRKTFFITGKLWNTLFEVAIYEDKQ
ncbi:MAG: glutaminyl-peptide cyclotransferase [Flavobacteriaceae bacterium]